MIPVKLTVPPGSGLPWWGEVRASINAEARWTVHEPTDEVERAVVEDWLNAKYGRTLLFSRASWGDYPALELARVAVNELNGVMAPERVV